MADTNVTPTASPAQVCADCGGQTRQAFATTTAYRACRRCGHVAPTLAFDQVQGKPQTDR